MGFLDSLFKNVVNKVVDTEVDKTVDSISESIKTSNGNQNSNLDNQPIQIMRPDISGQPTQEQCFFGEDNPDYSEGSMMRYYMFEKAECLYKTNPGAVEVDFCYYCADSEKQAEEGYELDLPYISLELSESSNVLKFAYNVVKNPVINHPYIYEKIQCDCKSGENKEEHYIIYKLYPVPNAEHTILNSRDLVLCFKPSCPTETRVKLIKAFELIAATMKVDFAEYHI